MKQEDFTTAEDREILSKPPPPSLILCRLFMKPYKVMMKDLQRKGRPNGYLKCKKCPDLLECCRYGEAELYKKGIRITRSVWSEKEKKYYRRLRHARDIKTSVFR